MEIIVRSLYSDKKYERAFKFNSYSQIDFFLDRYGGYSRINYNSILKSASGTWYYIYSIDGRKIKSKFNRNNLNHFKAKQNHRNVDRTQIRQELNRLSKKYLSLTKCSDEELKKLRGLLNIEK